MVIPDRPRRRRGYSLTAALLALAAFGCSEELGPPELRTARVVGRVRLGTQPVGQGWLEFHPIDATVGNLRSARIRPDGTFEAEGVAVGVNVIYLRNPSAQVGPDGIPTYGPVLGAFRLPILRREVAASGETTLDLDLLPEYLKFRREHPSG